MSTLLPNAISPLFLLILRYFCFGNKVLTRGNKVLAANNSIRRIKTLHSSDSYSDLNWQRIDAVEPLRCISALPHAAYSVGQKGSCWILVTPSHIARRTKIETFLNEARFFKIYFQFISFLFDRKIVIFHIKILIFAS